MDKKAHEKWLRKMGVHPTQMQRQKPRKLVADKFESRVAHVASESVFEGASCGMIGVKPTKVYTGDQLVGIATMHKSNSVPVFKREDAQDIANMRR